MSEPFIHINRPSNTRFVARVRMAGCRNYRVVGKPTRSKTQAIMRMAREFANGNYKRADVLVYADYYDPTLVVEMVRT